MRLIHSISIAFAFVLAATGASAAEVLAEAVYKQSGIRGGLVVQADIGDGELTLALCRGPAFTVDYLSREAGAVDAARAQFALQQPAGVVGGRLWTGKVLPYVDNLVNLFVAEEPLSVPMTEVMRVLAPQGIALIKKGATWKKTVKDWPEDLDQWTHWLHGADCNPVSQDKRVGPPRSVQWVGSPLWAKSHDASPTVMALVSSGGRVFYIADTGPVGIASADGRLENWHVCARDAFNGKSLWQQKLDDWGSRAWSPGDGVNRQQREPKMWLETEDEMEEKHATET